MIPFGPSTDPDTPHGRERWDALKHGLIELADGYTDTGFVQGAWRNNKTGEVTCEPCRQFLVSVPHDQEAKLWAMFWVFCGKFTQKCIYVAHGGDSWLVWPSDERPSKETLEWANKALLLDGSEPAIPISTLGGFQIADFQTAIATGNGSIPLTV